MKIHHEIENWYLPIIVQFCSIAIMIGFVVGAVFSLRRLTRQARSQPDIDTPNARNHGWIWIASHRIGIALLAFDLASMRARVFPGCFFWTLFIGIIPRQQALNYGSHAPFESTLVRRACRRRWSHINTLQRDEVRLDETSALWRGCSSGTTMAGERERRWLGTRARKRERSKT